MAASCRVCRVMACPGSGQDYRTCTLCRIGVVILAVTRIVGHGGEGDRREPRPDDAIPSRSSIHISIKPQGSVCWPPEGGDSGGGQPAVLGMNVPYLDPDHHRREPGRASRVTGDLEQSRAEEEHHAGIVGAELLVDDQAQHMAVRAAAPGPSRWGAGGSGCSERPRGYSSITLSDAGSH
jgi:hypothetical protein